MRSPRSPVCGSNEARFVVTGGLTRTAFGASAHEGSVICALAWGARRAGFKSRRPDQLPRITCSALWGSPALDLSDRARFRGTEAAFPCPSRNGTRGCLSPPCANVAVRALRPIPGQRGSYQEGNAPI